MIQGNKTLDLGRQTEDFQKHNKRIMINGFSEMPLREIKEGSKGYDDLKKSGV